MTDTTAPPPVTVVVMGVQGSGKSTLGRLVADRLGVPFVDGDSLHPQRNVELMAAGHALTDEDRGPWLAEVGAVLRDHRATGGVVVACSALKRQYRDALRAIVPDLFVIEPHGPIELVAERISARAHEYMPTTLLESQFATLQPLADDERGVRVSIHPSPSSIADTAIDAYRTQIEVAR